MLGLFLSFFFSLHTLANDVSETGGVEKGTSVFQNIFGSIIKDFGHKKLKKPLNFWVRSEVSLILHSQFELNKISYKRQDLTFFFSISFF